MTSKGQGKTPVAHYSKGKRLRLKPAIGAGREGTVHPVSDRPETAVKLIGADNPDPARTSAKLAAMVKHPPPTTASRHYRIAWPETLVSNARREGETTGYTMALMDPEVYRPIGSYINPSRRRQLLTARKSGYSYLHLVAMALNLARAVEQIHRHGAVVGDLSSRNVLASDRGRVAVIDTDSFQIHDPGSGLVYRSLVGTPEYTPPRLQGIDFAQCHRTCEDDLFGLAVMLYQLLMQGAHPYAGRQEGNDQDAGQNIAERISRGRFAHDDPARCNREQHRRLGRSPPEAGVQERLPADRSAPPIGGNLGQGHHQGRQKAQAVPEQTAPTGISGRPAPGAATGGSPPSNRFPSRGRRPGPGPRPERPRSADNTGRRRGSDGRGRQRIPRPEIPTKRLREENNKMNYQRIPVQQLPPIDEDAVRQAIDKESGFFMTTNLYWECNCEEYSARPATMAMCQNCGEFPRRVPRRPESAT